jgi:long-chain acyl-CoA synthetase
MNGNTTLAQLIGSLAGELGDKTYFISCDNGRSLSYQRLWQQCKTLGAQFAALGLEPGDKVSLYMPNGELTAKLLLGIMANGLVANPINLMCQPSQLRHILSHSDTRLVFAASEHIGMLSSALGEIGRDVLLVPCDPSSAELPVFAPAAEGALPEPAPLDPALLMYTSGTTGVPKVPSIA